MNDLERINLILAEMERHAILKADKSKLLQSAVDKLSLAREYEYAGKIAQTMAEEEIIALNDELLELDNEIERNVNALRSLQQVISLTDNLAGQTVEPEPEPEPTE